jgi:diaminohydroxyphosphoribosylaminopyrimidine deaminase/5-amino-6-(5-phosphoribosylamino)uracil reductase
VCGEGIRALSDAGIEVSTGVLAPEVGETLAPYLTHRRSGRPYVVVKLAASLDGRLAAPDGTSRWITGAAARSDAHELRADSDAILVGAATVRADDPELTVRLEGYSGRQPLRVVLGHASPTARVQPALELGGDLRGVLDELGRRGVLQLLVEGGAETAGSFHRLGLVDRYVFYLGPVLLGGADGAPVFAGKGAGTMAEAARGRIREVRRLGDDVRIDFEPLRSESESVPLAE